MHSACMDVRRMTVNVMVNGGNGRCGAVQGTDTDSAADTIRGSESIGYDIYRWADEIPDGADDHHPTANRCAL